MTDFHQRMPLVGNACMHPSCITTLSIRRRPSLTARPILLAPRNSAILSELAKAHDGVATHISLDTQFLDVSVAAQAGGKQSDVLLIGYLREATSHIGRGENSGRTLQEFNIVRSIKRLGNWNGSSCSFRIPLGSLPRDATHAAVLLQTQGQGPILGAASVPITARD